jgi:hypothetical protein
VPPIGDLNALHVADVCPRSRSGQEIRSAVSRIDRKHYEVYGSGSPYKSIRARRESMMESVRFDTAARLVSAAGSRRQALRVLVGVCLGTRVAPTLDPRPAAAQGSDCRVARETCTRNRQCRSKVCRKREGRQTGKCKSLGALAANCTPPPATCTDQTALPSCHVGATNGTCFSTLTGKVICADSLSCNTNPGSPPICDDDADCINEGANARCVDTCPGSVCIGGRACAKYAGEG